VRTRSKKQYKTLENLAVWLKTNKQTTCIWLKLGKVWFLMSFKKCSLEKRVPLRHPEHLRWTRKLFPWD
jgi:hypothetical protein